MEIKKLSNTGLWKNMIQLWSAIVSIKRMYQTWSTTQPCLLALTAPSSTCCDSFSLWSQQVVLLIFFSWGEVVFFTFDNAFTAYIIYMLEICMKDCERTNYPLEYQVPMHSLKQSLVSEWTSAISPPTLLWWRLSAHDQVWQARVVIKKYLFPEHSHVCLQPRFPLWCYQGLAGSHAMLRG